MGKVGPILTPLTHRFVKGPFKKKMGNNGKDILRILFSDFVNLNVMYVYTILWEASVCNSQAACYVLSLLEAII